MKPRSIMGTLVASALLAMLPSTLQAASFPDKPVEAVVPWAPGGGGDLVFRAMATVFPKHANGQPLLIKNIPGAAGVPGIVEFMKARPDGYTIAHWNGAQTIKTHMSRTPYDATQFAPVANIVSDSFYLLVKADSKYKTVQDLIEAAKAAPGRINMGNAGTGGGTHFTQVMFEDAAGIETNQVPFQGGGPLVTGLLSDQIEVSMQAVPEGSNNIMNGQLRILAIFTPERHPYFPDAPTAKEQGIDLAVNQYRGIVAPVNTPPERLAELEAIFKKVTEDPDFQAQMKEMGNVVDFLPGAEYGKTLEEDSAMYLKIIKEKKLGDLHNR